MAKRLIRFLLVSFLLSSACFSQGIFITDLPEAQLEDISTPDLLLLVDLDEADPNDQAKKMTLETFQLFLAETFSGGGLDKWVTATEYEIDDVVWLEDDNKIYRATVAHTSGISFNPANWQELSEQPDLSDYVRGPVSSVVRQVPVYSDTSGKELENSKLLLPNMLTSVRLAGNTEDGADDHSMTLTPASGLGPTRGAWFGLYGNEHANKPSDIAFQLGENAGADFDIQNPTESIFNLTTNGNLTVGESDGTSYHLFHGDLTISDQFGRSLGMIGNTIQAQSGGGDASLTLQHQPGGTVVETDGTNATTLGRNDSDTNIMNDGSFELGDGELTCTSCTLAVVPAFSPTFKNRYAIRASFSASTGTVCYTKTSSSYEGHKLSAAITVVNSASNGIYFRAQRNGAAITGIEQHVKVSATPERYVLPQFIGGNTSLGWCIEATEAITADIDFDNAFIGAGEAEVIRDYFDVVETKYLNADVTTGGTTLTDLTFNDLIIGDEYEVNLHAQAYPASAQFAGVSIIHDGSTIGRAGIFINTSSSGYVSSTVVRFKATATTLTFVSNCSGGCTINGDGTQAETFAQLTHKKSGSYINSTTIQEAGEIYFNGNDSCRPGDVGFGEEISRTDYPELFAKWGERFGEGDGSTTFMTPPRGYFLRIADEGAGNDPDAASRVACDTGGATGDVVGSCQLDAFQGHHHSITGGNGALGLAYPAGSIGGSIGTFPNQGATSPKADGVNGTPRTSNETRAKNIAMRGCIVARTARVVAELTETVKYDGSEMLDRERIDNGDGTFSQVYKRCWRVESDITSATTIATIDTGLSVLDAQKTASTVWLLTDYSYATGTGDKANLSYNSSSGAISYDVNGRTVYAGTRPCIRYTK